MNLSQKKRNELLSFLGQLRKEHTDDASVIAFNEIENELTSKKYGLVWEEHSENVDEQMKTQVPVFKNIPERTIISDKELPYNFLLEGDNLHSLKLLEKTHKGKIDVIYIDPPYNTGNKDFIYNDTIVGSDDGYKHSKWLSFMEKRLGIAKILLRNSGVIFISIDDNEQSTLKLLCDSIFGEENFVMSIPRITKKSGKTTNAFARNHDYVLIYTKKENNIFVMEEHIDDNFKHSDEFESERGKYKLNQTLDYDSLSYSASLDYPLTIEGETFYPGGDIEKWKERQQGNHKRADWAWRWSKKLFDFGYKNGFIVVKRKKDGTARIYTKTYLNAKISKDKSGEFFIEYEKRTKAMSSIDLIDNIYSNDNAKKDLKSFGFDKEFDYPKPCELIKKLIKLYYKKDAMVLDFFAGSGTTAQAVMELNNQDGGNRRFILCTNNENGICENITYQRVKTVITGKRTDGTEYSEGISANLKYFKTEFIPKQSEEEDYSVSDNLLNHIPEMVELQHATDIDNARHILVLTDEDADNLTEEQLAVCEELYVSSSVLLTAKQERMFKQLGINVLLIPDYYFESELLEVGER